MVLLYLKPDAVTKNKNREVKSMVKKERSNPARWGLLIFILALLISAAIVFMTYMPYRYYIDIAQNCTHIVTATVVEDGAQEKEDGYYYGPRVEYTYYQSGATVRTNIINTVNLGQTWEEGDTFAAAYNPNDPSTIIIKDDETAKNRFKIASVIGIILSAAGLIVMIITLITAFIMTRPSKYSENIAGQSFEQWKQEQVDIMEEKIADSKSKRQELTDSENKSISED